MRKVKEILRLGLKEGRTQREIARSTGVGKTTIQQVLGRARAAGLDWATLSSLREYEIVQRCIYPGEPGGCTPKPLPDWAAVRMELMKEGTTLTLVWMDYKQEHPDGLQYSRFCEL